MTKRVLRWIFLVGLIAAAFAVGIPMSLQWNAFRKTGIDVESLSRGMAQHLSSAQNATRKAQAFTQEDALEQLGESRLNGFCYRFDNNLNRAKRPAGPTPETMRTASETMRTAPETMRTASETVRTASETMQTASETMRTASETVRTASETVRTASETVRTASETVRTASETMQTASPCLLGFEFDGKDAIGISAEEGKFEIRNGILAMRWPGGNMHLQSVGEFAIDRNLIGEVEIRMKQEKGRTIGICWGTDVDKARVDQGGRGVLTVHTVPDNLFHTYRIDLRNALKQERASGDIIRRVFLRPSDVAGDPVQIDYVRFHSKSHRYAEAPCGRMYETINKEMRCGLYMNTPFALEYEVPVPKGQSVLRTGMGILLEKAPVTFRVTVRNGTQETEALNSTLESNGAWEEGQIDCSQWAGQTVSFQFEARGSGGGSAPGAPNVAFWSNPVLCTPPRERFNVIIVLEDAMRADFMSCYGYPKNTTPVKDQFAKQGVVFLNAFSQETVTRTSCASFMTSLYPTATGVWNHTDMLSEAYLTLAEVLRSQGFATASFIQNDNAGAACGIHQGFCNLFDDSTLTSRTQGMYAEPLAKWIAANKDRNFFLYLHLLEPHCPYDPPAPFDAEYRKAAPGQTEVKRNRSLDPDWVQKPTAEGRRLLYEGQVRHNDYCFATFLEMLRQAGVDKDTLVVLTGDHGEFLGEHNLWTHEPPGFVQVLRVPLIMVYPGHLPAGIQLEQNVQLLDLMPAILDLAGVPREALLLHGHSLLSLIRGENPDDWKDRPALSEEVLYLAKNKTMTGGWGSVFHQNWHLDNSAKFAGVSVDDPNHLPRGVFLKAFDRTKDREEQTAGTRNMLLRAAYRGRVRSVLRRMQDCNLILWRTLTRGKEGEILIDPDAQRKLEGLIYLKPTKGEKEN